MAPAEDETPMLGRSVTFQRGPKPAAYNPEQPSFLSRVMGSKTAPTGRVSESLDYEPIQNKLFYDRMKTRKEGKKKLYGYTGHTLAKMLVTVLTGIITGFFAVGLSKFTSLITKAKLNTLEGIWAGDGGARGFMSFLVFWLIGSIMVSAATALVQYWAPASAGAGVTLVMAYLNGNHVPNLLRFNTLINKFIGTICAVSSGLPMGPEGPMVHIGACVASCITYVECRCLDGGVFNIFTNCFGRRQDLALKEKLKILDEIVSDSDHREFVSAGVSAGISAAFGAPIGGVLFSMEEACSFWSRKTAWRCFIAASLSTYTIQLLQRSATHGMIAFTGLNAMENKDWLMQLPFLFVNSGMAGLLGAAFNSFRMWLWKVRAIKTRHLLRILEVIGLVFLVSLVGHFFGWAAGTCRPLPEAWEEEGYGLTFNCQSEYVPGEEGAPEIEKKYYNDVATLFLSSQHHTIIRLFSVGHEDELSPEQREESGRSFTPPFSVGGLALFTTTYLGLMSIGAGLAIPGGLFMPSILLGASWGCFWGTILRMWLPHWNIMPGLYAILAGTGVLAGVFRSAISLVVLVVEGTRGIDYLFGVILSVVMANWVAHHIHHDGVYESELERIGNVYMLRDEPPHRLFTLTADSIMATGVVGFRVIEPVSRILQVMRTTTHNGFPVFAEGTDGEEGDVSEAPSSKALVGMVHSSSAADMNGGSSAASKVDLLCGRLEGVILRSQLLVLLQRRHFCDAEGRPIGRDYSEQQELDLETEMRTFFRRYFTHARYISATAQPLDELKLDGVHAGSTTLDLSNLYMDLRPYMNRSPLTIRKDCSAARAHQVFLNLGLRHLLVVDAHNHVVGIITRKDLDHAAGHGWWRMSHMAEPPRNKLLRHLRGIPSVGFLARLIGVGGPAPPPPAAAEGGHADPEHGPSNGHPSSGGH
ncbi:hypothetical protein HYH03_015647 [Edaphochlamys debaryana]|uniref:Chloride channel protein n=1 Tax=Edaphochlamys debaryana TaxID=47281 RepID=A0A835XRK2_9CHLO|nr:hypothetical protein HYH03_015647 [Edaphochlamys debaryana]|eukprot:KAG2485675.1 hypothetical protein HYH03_015647 [Edaphochlamys debaryana]